MDLGLKGKYALITGASHGIGRSIALALAEEGCNVAICARNESRVKQVADEIRDKGVDSLGFVADVMNPNEIKKVMSSFIKKWGTIDILVNNVGGGGRWGKDDVGKTEEKIWIDVYNKNALAAIRFTMQAIPHMRRQKWGRVITVTSIFGREGGGRPWFNMAKAAQTALMKNLSMNPGLVRDGITFNSVAPGAIMIPDTGWAQERDKNPREFDRKIKSEFPLGRLGTPEEVANIIIFICSRQASLLNGASIPIDGGEGHSF
ncbi:MAG: SDR family oxidoreductase [Candidatus Omnitrophota bacterium]|jgi:3-oxoacyl-[acyl-carrier protein] reductase